MPTNSMPPNWEPPAPAWESKWNDSTDPLLTGFYGIQADDSSLLDEWASKAFAADNGPVSVERGSYIDKSGIKNFIYIAYWRSADYHAWWQQDVVNAWWSDEQREKDDAGFWREIISMPFDRFETLHSTEEPHGIGVWADGNTGPIAEHGYPGGMRDRIQLSDSEDLRSKHGFDTQLVSKVNESGVRVVVIPPENMCVIRSGQNWTYCEPEEKEYYQNEMHAVLLKGMAYLRDNPIESGVYSLRFVDTKDDKWGDMTQSFGLGYSTDLYAFEDWAKSHPTHLAIFETFFTMVDKFGENMKLRLWHEVTSIPGKGCEFEYISCNKHTGLLSYI